MLRDIRLVQSLKVLLKRKELTIKKPFLMIHRTIVLTTMVRFDSLNFLSKLKFNFILETLKNIQGLRLFMYQIQVIVSRVVIYEQDKILLFVCTSSKTSLAFSAPNFLMFFCFPFIHSTQTSKFDKSKGSRILSDISI